ncbi:hypothetical protein DSO57_1012306 [Entomophthora muscae]|uniref:Uncharacterized protein n=1 Tax=Entomophthora muscae TaxID=34485 RepID=A0ACC2T664_9FUNG|nr:hypothetical protein DSO57_1012306 [Entomophthora muscae]
MATINMDTIADIIDGIVLGKMRGSAGGEGSIQCRKMFFNKSFAGKEGFKRSGWDRISVLVAGVILVTVAVRIPGNKCKD